ncbi:MAG TPA: TonB-dependent receptor plug domain-containing protein [Luteimonas sp.]|nr:TonB-dependent receptor plug domain-containing protein [Luteimonas sp.]
MSLSIRQLALVAALLASPPFAFAQDAAAPQKPAVGRVYTPDAFARFAPRNALDMLQQVPGFVIRQEVQERGLGQATGNVLVNGQRPSGKSNDVLALLSRIPARNVVRIEIRDGATLDIPGLSGPVANVIAKAGGASGQWKWQPDVRRYYTHPQLTRGEVSVSGSNGRVDYTLGLKNNANHSGAGGDTFIHNADGSLREYRNEQWTGEIDQPQLSGHLGYTGAGGDIGNLNASWQSVSYHYIEDGTRTGPALPDRQRSVRSTQGGYNYEIGGDYAFGLGPGTLKLIGLDRFNRTPTSDTVITRVADGSTAAEGNRFTRLGETTERIARAEYRWKAAGDWQLSTEYAFNKLDSVSGLYDLAGDGSFVAVPLPGGTATVQEDRYEAIASYGHALTSKATLQVAAGGEFSTIQELGAGGLSRSFRRPKGEVSLAWKPAPGFDLNVKLQRSVGQLDFYQFLASVDLNNGQANAGNPELVPPQTTELDIEATRDLGAWGTTSLRLYAQRIDDIVDTIPIGASGESPGNIDRATRRGFEWKATFNLDGLGWQGAKVDTRLQKESSRVRDPLTGQPRPISNNLKDLAEITLRDDIPGSSWAWGMDVSYSFYARDYRLTEVGRLWEGPVWGSLYIERKDFHGLTLRASADNIFSSRSMWDRTVYVDRRTGPVDFVEDRDRRIGPIVSFTVSGTF